ncbi:Tubby-like F-box 7 [Olea europaea subsp. europaea]|uniref:Tubby-like F-box 7 n=1 Tax=Olea europaea subsp. europaea TaxID=158383 RepID=A0A8S0TNQ4_OLEEU|nr:Tubby-like F-box 7 [Olea europaea subsp. europaea]
MKSDFLGTNFTIYDSQPPHNGAKSLSTRAVHRLASKQMSPQVPAVASVKNFQLVATIDQSKPGGKGDDETVLLQFGKLGDDTFTMDYQQPLSAFRHLQFV